MRFKQKRELTFDVPRIMGILNVTPDSFSDAGSYFTGGAVEHALEMISHGADVIDIGGESTRPGSDPVPEEEELRRIIPVIEELSSITDIPISVDTMKTKVAEAALEAGADIINDVNGLRAEGMMETASSFGAPVIIMHMNGVPKTMQAGLSEGIITGQIADFFKERIETAHDHGIKEIMLDPGVGFGKTVTQNLEIIDNIRDYSFGYPVLIGPSRKRFLSEVYPGAERDDATADICKRSVGAGASMLRVHNVERIAGVLRSGI